MLIPELKRTGCSVSLSPAGTQKSGCDSVVLRAGMGDIRHGELCGWHVGGFGGGA